MKLVRFKSKHTESGFIHVYPEKIAAVFTALGEVTATIRLQDSAEVPVDEFEGDVLYSLAGISAFENIETTVGTESEVDTELRGVLREYYHKRTD